MRMAAQSGSARVAKCLRITEPAPSERMGLPRSSRRVLVQPLAKINTAMPRTTPLIPPGVWG